MPPGQAVVCSCSTYTMPWARAQAGGCSRNRTAAFDFAGRDPPAVRKLCLRPRHQPAMPHGADTLLLELFAIFVWAKIFGELFERLSLPAVLGEILAGIILRSE